MAQVLSQVNTHKQDQNILFSQNNSDDAGVYQLTDDVALVQTVDYFTPIVDDPYTFGQIAAANALSDVYAMGAEVKTALNIVGFSVKKYGADHLAQILQGAEDKVHEAGGAIIGGHSIDDEEPKFGLSVTGIAHPDQILTNHNAQDGNVLVLTKPIGIGIITTAIKKGLASQNDADEAINWMMKLNKEASELFKQYEVHAVTDVTGFGLLGHAYEMAKGSQLSLEIDYQSVPIIDGTVELAAKGAVPGGTKSNLNWLEDAVSFESHINELHQLILADAITSGGLLISMPEHDANQYIDELNQLPDYQATIIGKVIPQTDRNIIVK
ncbi:selenide, water dikinase [Tenuibacillus multivorans]|uniref:Selenide, water dikinase n=1 Tax=Tenuibacillus multivorans TaxID=237069 RepID=A0A1H0CHT8_9BACI|nr:selenide, water dikinase [Tenuibacillus multivorans]SDN57373.1 selenide, water dikinase [Tenuibacillus multivorans]